MFVKQAHSYSQQARLAISLSWIAGYTNVLTLLFCGQATSHLSGTISLLGRHVAEGDAAGSLYVLTLTVVFLLGALLSGLLTELARAARWRSIYLLPVAVEAGLLVTFALLLHVTRTSALDGQHAPLWLTLLPSASMGLQNATITCISGGIVRTTHVTGVVTDLGLEGALWSLRKLGWSSGHGNLRVSSRRLLLLLCIVASFAVGAGLGTLAFAHLPQWSMAPAVLFLLAIVLHEFWHPVGDIYTNRDADGTLHDVLPSGIAVFHVKAGRQGLRRRTRLPDLVTWAGHLEPEVEVVVLDISELTRLDFNSALEIRALHAALRPTDRNLILAGVQVSQHDVLRKAGLPEILQPRNILGNLDLAGARALLLLEERDERRVRS